MNIDNSNDKKIINDLIIHFNNKLKNIEERNNIKVALGDVVYYFANDTKLVTAKIVSINEYRYATNEPTRFYRVVPANIFIVLLEKLRYKWSVITRTDYIPGKIFFTHTVKLGKDIFLTEEDAEKAYLLQNAMFYLQELIDYNE